MSKKPKPDSERKKGYNILTRPRQKSTFGEVQHNRYVMARRAIMKIVEQHKENPTTKVVK